MEILWRKFVQVMEFYGGVDKKIGTVINRPYQKTLGD
jgi:hypothetical protein